MEQIEHQEETVNRDDLETVIDMLHKSAALQRWQHYDINVEHDMALTFAMYYRKKSRLYKFPTAINLAKKPSELNIVRWINQLFGELVAAHLEKLDDHYDAASVNEIRTGMVMDR